MTETFTLKGIPQECPPAEFLYIAVPAYTGEVGVHTMHALGRTIRPLAEAGIAIHTNFTAGCCYLDHTRNLLVKDFLAHTECTDLLFVDADVGFRPEDALALCMLTKPLTSGVYPKKSEIPQWPVQLPSPTFHLQSDGTIEVPLMPTGFMRIHRSVFEYLLEQPGLVPKYHDPQVGDMFGFFKTEIKDGLYWGEDYQFCRDWVALGGKCWIVPDMEFTHTGPKHWKGNLMEWIREKATGVKIVDSPTSTAA